MRKLTAAQARSVASRKGLFDHVIWSGCVAYLYALLANPDPENNECWIRAIALIKSYLEWSLMQARARFGVNGGTCLLMASSKEMTPEKEHPLNESPCVFSGRKSPELHPPSMQAVYTRVQRTFRWWDHHEDTGLECPHESYLYVYESRYSFLIEGIYTLGHIAAILRRYSQECPSVGDADAFARLPIWATLYERINCVLFVVQKLLTE